MHIQFIIFLCSGKCVWVSVAVPPLCICPAANVGRRGGKKSTEHQWTPEFNFKSSIRSWQVLAFFSQAPGTRGGSLGERERFRIIEVLHDNFQYAGFCAWTMVSCTLQPWHEWGRFPSQQLMWLPSLPLAGWSEQFFPFSCFSFCSPSVLALAFVSGYFGSSLPRLSCFLHSLPSQWV